MRVASIACVVALVAGVGPALAQPATAPPPSPAQPPTGPEVSEAFGVGVGQVSGASGDDMPLVFSFHAEFGRPMLPGIRLVVGFDLLARFPEPDFEEGMMKPRSQGTLMVGGRIEPLPRVSFASVAGLAATDYVVDVECDFLFGCDDITKTVFGLAIAASARVVLVDREGRWKDVGLEAHVTRAQYMDLGGVLTADVGLVFGRL